MTVREIRESELNNLLELYKHLHELGVPEDSEHLHKNPDLHTAPDSCI